MRILLLTASLLAASASAGPGMWTTSGPDGGGLSFLATSPASPATVYVGTGFALFRSTDSGLTFSRRAAGQDLGYITDVVVSGSNADLVYVLNESRVMKSTDGGASFIVSSAGLPTSNFFTTDLALDPATPTTLILTSRSHGAFRSTDGGSSWTAIGTAILPPKLALVAIDPGNPQRLLVSPCAPDDGSPYSGAHLYRSLDGGASFAAVSVTGLGAGDATCAAALAFSPVTPGVVLGSYGFGPFQPSNLILRSTDSGATFSTFTAGPSNTHLLASYSFVPGSPGEVLAGNARGAVQRSTNDGASFSAAPTPVFSGPSAALESQVVATKPGDPTIRYFISRGAGFFRSTDSGASWTERNVGNRSVNVRAIAINPVFPSTIYAGQGESEGTAISWPFFRSFNGGGVWTAAGNGFDADWFRTLLVDSNTAATPASTVLYGGGRDLAPARALALRASGVAKSSDNGNSWTNLAGFAGLGGAGQPVLASLSTVRAIVPDRTVVTGGAWSKLYLTATGNATCTSIGGAVTVTTPRLWRTLDAGNSWNTIATAGSAAGVGSDGLPAGECVNGGTSADPFALADYPIPVPLVVDHADANTLYVGTYLRSFVSSSSYVPQSPNGVFKSTDGGLTWAEASVGLPLQAGSSSAHYSVLALVMDPSNRNVLYAAVNPFFDNSAFVGNVYKTTNGGASWAVAGTGLAGQDIRALLVDPDNALRVYAASGGSSLNPGGVFVSEDGGNSWNSISAGLPLSSATALALDSSVAATPTLYAGSRTGLYAFTRVADGDGDGASSSNEAGAPNSGDGNGDGQPDSGQSNVASLPGTSSSRAALPFTLSVTPLSGSCTRLYDVIAVPAATFAADPTLQKPDGAFRFEIANCASARVSLKIHGGSFNARSFIRAFGARVQGDPLSINWNNLAATVSGDTISFTLTDNQPGDARQDNNRILFQGGPAFELPLFGNGFE